MTHNLIIYMIAVLTVNLFPGPDMIYIMSQSIRKGRLYGVISALGVGAGCFIHIFAVALGLSSIIFQSAIAFKIIKYLGASYLLYIGFTSLLKKQPSMLSKLETARDISLKKSFTQGFLTNILNPKVALFFMAFLPQFVNISSKNSIGLQLLLLGLLFNLSGTIVNILVGLFFGSVKTWITQHPTALKIQGKITGFILIGLGLRLATFEKAS